MATRLVACAVPLVLALTGCGKNKACDPLDPDACKKDQVCEAVEDGEPTCFDPVVVRGTVYDLGDDAAIEGARVVALDVNGAGSSTVGTTDADGAYEVKVPTTRDAEGLPIGAKLTLRVDAQGYQTYPSGLRQSVPFGSEGAVEEDGVWVVSSTFTDVGLTALPDGHGTGVLRGAVEVPPNGASVLVVAEGGSAHTAIADRGGDYAIFNLDPGDYSVSAYAKGNNYESGSASVPADEEVTLDLVLADSEPGRVDGTVQIVNAPGGSMTSVVLVVESTFDELLARGEVPPGLRAPEGGVDPNITGSYSIDGVPAGRWVVLAAFENDGLVRDPDPSIGGTQIQHITVDAGQTVTVEGFKITGALAVFSPGADEPEAVTGAPLLAWEDDSSEDAYEVVVWNSFGDIVWETELPGFSGDDPSVEYGGPLEPGVYYQMHVTSIKDGSPIATTEDLQGIFYVE